MIDVHAHFADEGYSFPEEWEKIKAAGVHKVILAGDSLSHSMMHRDFCAEHEGAYFSAGVHPSEIQTIDADMVGLSRLLEDEKCVAVGEIGLDYHFPEGLDKEKQRRAFAMQMELAHEKGLPVQIHSRDAFQDTLSMLREMRELLSHRFLLHCYSYGAEHLDEFLELGSYFSFGGVTCFKNARNVAESVKACPLDRLLTETDSPYLSPLRGEKNTPANIPLIVKKIAEIKGLAFDEVIKAVRENASRLFRKL